MLSAGLIPQQKYVSDRFWDNASRSLFSTAMQKLECLKDHSIHELHRVLVTADLNEFECFFKETEAASYTSKDGEKMILSVRSNLAVQIKSLKYLNDQNKHFSLRQWVQEERQKNWLFITARPDQRESLKPLISCWLEIAFNAVMSLAPDQQRRIWFMIDELPALQQLPSLPLALAELRKYGGCIMVGIQGMPQSVIFMVMQDRKPSLIFLIPLSFLEAQIHKQQAGFLKCWARRMKQKLLRILRMVLIPSEMVCP